MSDEPDVEIAPEPFRSGASVVPENCEHAPERPGMSDQCIATLPRLAMGQVESVTVEQSPILNMQRKLEKLPRSRWSKNLSGSGPVADRLVISDCRVVRETSVLEYAKRILIEQQPMHPNADVGIPADLGDSSQLVAPLVRAVPGVDAVYSELTPFFHDHGDAIRQVVKIVFRRSARRMR